MPIGMLTIPKVITPFQIGRGMGRTSCAMLEQYLTL
jgi:hypothetical protein